MDIKIKQEQALQLIIEGKYTEFFNLLDQLNFKEWLIVLLPKNPKEEKGQIVGNKYFIKGFWSEITKSKHFSSLLSDKDYIYQLNQLFAYYFMKWKNANTAFIDYVSSICPNYLIKTIKLEQSFNKKEHWKSFEIFKSHKNIKLQHFYKEINFVKEILSKWNKHEERYRTTLNLFGYEDILMHTVSYYEKFKRSSQRVINNHNHIVSMEINLNYVLNEILNIKKEEDIKEKKEITNKYSILDLKNNIKKILPPINPVEGIAKRTYLPDEKITDEKKEFREMMEFYFAFHGLKHQINKYLSGFAEFEIIDNLEAELKTNKRFSVYQRNDSKTTYAEMLFFNKASENKEFLNQVKGVVDKSNRETLLNIYADKAYFNYLKLPFKYKSNNSLIDFEKVLKLLKVFSLFFMPYGRNIIETIKNGVPKTSVFNVKNKPDDFKDYFYEDYIVCFEEKELLYNCEMYFNWDNDETKNIINYLTTDLNSTKSGKIDFLKKPLIKIGTQYIWLSSLLRDRAWNIMMHRRIVAENLHNHVEQSEKLEKQIADEFINADFSAISSHKYRASEYKGEIDTLAYKNNTLFIIELKTTYTEENLLRTVKYENRQLNMAVSQLSRAIKYVKNNFNQIKNIKELEINCSLEELKIQPLIISNIFDSDGLLINNKYLKISLFELLVILNNDLYDMLNLKTGKVLHNSDTEYPVPMLLQMQNQFAPNIKSENIKTDKKSCNLWKDNKNCTTNDLITAIKENKVWDFLNDLTVNKPERIELTEFDANKKMLV